jgi:hypothetical protein
MSSMMRVLAVVAFVLASRETGASAQVVDERYQTWLGVFAHGPASGDVWLWADVQGRFYDSFEPQTVLVRPGISWRVVPDIFLTLGYAWTPSWARGEEWGALELTDEHRIWQQYLYAPSMPAHGLSGQLRLRVEERMRSVGPFEVGVRVRLFARVQAAVDRDKTVFVIAWDEVFLALNETGWQTAGFDQNRFFFGLGWQAIPSQLRFELGYVNQWLARNGADPVNHIAMLSAFVGWTLPTPAP